MITAKRRSQPSNNNNKSNNDNNRKEKKEEKKGQSSGPGEIKNIHVFSEDKSRSKVDPPLVNSDNSSSAKEIFSYQKHSMDYVTVSGVMLRTGYNNKTDWYLLCPKELIDNGVDFYWKNYQGTYNEAKITVDITKYGSSSISIKVRNSNSKNIPVFGKENLDLIFNYDMRYGSKQNEYVITRGTLGDAMKQVLALP